MFTWPIIFSLRILLVVHFLPIQVSRGEYWVKLLCPDEIVENSFDYKVFRLSHVNIRVIITCMSVPVECRQVESSAAVSGMEL